MIPEYFSEFAGVEEFWGCCLERIYGLEHPFIEN